MEVILKQDIPSLGYKNDLIGVLRDLEAARHDYASKDRIRRLRDALVLAVQFLKVYIAFKA